MSTRRRPLKNGVPDWGKSRKLIPHTFVGKEGQIDRNKGDKRTLRWVFLGRQY